MKNSAGRGERYPPRPKAEVDKTLYIVVRLYGFSTDFGRNVPQFSELNHFRLESRSHEMFSFLPFRTLRK